MTHVGRTDGRTVGRSVERTDGRSHGRSVGQSNVRTDGRSVGRSDGRSVGRSNGRTDGRTAGRSVERSDGRTAEERVQSRGIPGAFQWHSGGIQGAFKKEKRAFSFMINKNGAFHIMFLRIRTLEAAASFSLYNINEEQR